MGLFDNLRDEDNEEKRGFFQKPAEPVKELLPQRNSPYIGTNEEEPDTNGDFEEFANFGIPNPAISPTLSDTEIETMANIETTFLMLKLDTFVNIGKGVIAEFIVSEEDFEILRQYQSDSTTHSHEEIQSILDKVELKKKLENYKSENADSMRELLHKIVKADIIEKRKNGTLKLPSTSEFINRMLVNQFTELTGKNVQLLSTVGANIFKRVKGLI